MLLNRLKELGLDNIFDYQGDTYQVTMAKRLRQLAFDYLEGKLKNITPDGECVKNLRTNLNEIGGMQQFIKKQKPNGAWATDIELTLLSELLGVNFFVEYNDKIDPKTRKNAISCLSTAFDPNKHSITLINSNNTHWDGKLNAQKDSSTVHDGNCGYNSFARAIESIARPVIEAERKLTTRKVNENQAANKTESKPRSNPADHESTTKIAKTLPVDIKQERKLLEEIALQEQILAYNKKTAEQNNRYKSIIDTNSPKGRTWNAAFQDYSADQQKQYEQDRQLALRIAIAELPGVEGKSATAASNHQQDTTPRRRY